MKILSVASLIVGIVLSAINIFWLLSDQRFRESTHLSEIISQRAAEPAIEQTFLEFSPAYFESGFGRFAASLKENSVLPRKIYANDIGKIVTASCRLEDCSD